MKRFRCKAQMKQIIKNKKASIWLPIRLLISIAIISFFTTLMLIGAQNGSETINKNDFHKELIIIKQSIESLYRNGQCRNILNIDSPTGSKRVFNINIPDTIESVYFGKKKNESNEMSGSIRYYFSQEPNMIWLDSDINIILGEQKEDRWNPNKKNLGLSLHAGEYKLTAELICNNINQFILIYCEDI